MKKINQPNSTMKNQEMNMKKVLTGFLIASFTVLNVPTTEAAAGKGTSGGQFLRLGVAARAAGMAGAFSPIANDASAIYYNPAGLSTLEKREVSVSYNLYFEDTASQFLGYAHPTESAGTFGVAADMFTVDKIERRSLDGDFDEADSEFNTRDMALSFGWANKLDVGESRLHYGFALKYISSDLETDSAKTGAADLGAIYRLHEDHGLSLSAALLNLGGKLKFEDNGDELPLNFKPGAAYKFNMEKMGSLTAAVDADLLLHDGVATVQPGLEWWPVSAFAVRTGYQFGRDDGAGSGFAAGLGFRFSTLGIDYAFVPYGDLGNTHRMTLGLKF